jgi:hypothetical protein
MGVASLVAAAASAQGRPDSTGTWTAHVAAPADRTTKPFSRLFGADKLFSAARPLLGAIAQGTTPKARVVCGTTVIMAAPVDPAMVKQPDDTRNYTMRRVPPPACSSRH